MAGRNNKPKAEAFFIPSADDILKAEGEHLKQFVKSTWAIYQFNLRNNWLDLMMKAIQASWQLAERNPNKDLFQVFSILGTRLVSHHNAIRVLLMSGRYGETAALCRMLLELTDLITYFVGYPDEATDWRASFSQPPERGNQLYQDGLRSCSPARVRESLIAEQLPVTPQEIYAQFSAAIHPNEWGMYMYGQLPVGGQGPVELSFQARFDVRNAFGLGFLANRTLAMPIWSFLQICLFSGANKSLWRKIRTQYDDILPIFDAMYDTDSEMISIFQEMEDRVGAGEDVTNDITSRFEKLEESSGLENFGDLRSTQT